MFRLELVSYSKENKLLTIKTLIDLIRPIASDKDKINFKWGLDQVNKTEKGATAIIAKSPDPDKLLEIQEKLNAINTFTQVTEVYNF